MLPSLPSHPGADDLQPCLSVSKGRILQDLEGDLLQEEPHFVPRARPCGVTPPNPSPAGCRPPAAAPYQHLAAEPAQMLQECGSATTRYCRNAPRVGKGRARAVLPPPFPLPSTHKQLPVSGAGVPSAALGQAVGTLAPQGAKICLLPPLPLDWAGGWAIWPETKGYPGSVLGALLQARGPSCWCSTVIRY